MTFLWLILSLLGFGIIIYGIFLFFVMPATGVFLILAGLICMNIGFKKKRMECGSQNSGKRMKEKGLSDQGGLPS